MTTPAIPQTPNVNTLRRNANAIFAQLSASGPTSARPSSPSWVGQPFFDTTLGVPIWWSGAHWVNASGATV